MSNQSFPGGAVDLSKLGGSAPGSDDVTKSLSVHDSEILKIERILNAMRIKAQSAVNYQAFQDEIIERFADIGFDVDVRWYETNVERVLMPEINIKGRVEPKVFDSDQQVHEVTNDLLGLGDGGVIKTDKGKVAAMLDGSYKGSLKDVGHGHSH